MMRPGDASQSGVVNVEEKRECESERERERERSGLVLYVG